MRKLISPHTCRVALLQRQVDWTEFWTNESPLVRREMNEQAAISAAATGAHDTRQKDWTGSELSRRTSFNCIVQEGQTGPQFGLEDTLTLHQAEPRQLPVSEVR